MLTPLKWPDNRFRKYSDEPKHPKVVLTSDEENASIKVLEIRRKSKRTIKTNITLRLTDSEVTITRPAESLQTYTPVCRQVYNFIGSFSCTMRPKTFLLNFWLSSEQQL